MIFFLLGTVFGSLLANIFFFAGEKTNISEKIEEKSIDSSLNIENNNGTVRPAQIIRKLTPAQKALKEDE